MATIIRVIVLALAAVFTTVSAQDFQGVATYKTQRQLDIKMDSTQMDSDMQKQMIEMMKKQFQKTFLLNFNKEESTYKEDEELDQPTAGMAGNIQIVSIGGGGGSGAAAPGPVPSVTQTDQFRQLYPLFAQSHAPRSPSPSPNQQWFVTATRPHKPPPAQKKKQESPRGGSHNRLRLNQNLHS